MGSTTLVKEIFLHTYLMMTVKIVGGAPNDPQILQNYSTAVYYYKTSAITQMFSPVIH